MELTKNDICAFDECSVLHLCEIIIPKNYRLFCNDKEKICFEHFNKLNSLIIKINTLGSRPFMFKPYSSLDNNLLTASNNLLENNNLDPSKIKMGRVLKQEIIDQIKEFMLFLKINFQFIEKSEDFSDILEFFKNNEKELTKEKNIPEEDDCKILAGYINFALEGNKFLISEDEHFWRYKDLILENYNINIIEEWNCHLLGSDTQ